MTDDKNVGSIDPLVEVLAEHLPFLPFPLSTSEYIISAMKARGYKWTKIVETEA